jgi:hypothetical protein
MGDPITTIHSAMFGVFLVMASIVVVAVLYRLLVARNRPELSAAGRRREKVYLIVMVLLGWGSALSGTFWVYPRQLLASGSQTVALYPRGLESRILVAWMAAIVMTMVGYVLTRYKDEIGEHRRVRGTAAVFALVALVATGVANGIGALIGK